ncbi:caspase-1-like isoform X2 [Diorhabda carinulata]|uniref:caspase-1-like isoform X2 n=1 Tax=Diorhabda sublineata TaxID=1163346 RepID=UPI0024E0B113|nr:caspase-1-like isoform X2 [Diorhabda sublineata]XP_057661364.1 caspase-1-like isoform X2 [Diorhabda carinulata]
MKMDNKGTDQVGNGFSTAEETFEDAQDGQCFGQMSNGKRDERDALGKPGNATGELYAKMPVAKYSTHYKMNHKRRGLAYIFNHEFFEVGSLKPRGGTNEDCRNLKECLIALGFDVHVFKDLNYSDIELHIKKAARMDHSDNDCLIISILSHGESGIIYAKDTPYKPDHLWVQFTADRCPSLAGKPKIFFLQACQGDKLDGGVNLSKTETDGEIHNTYKIPVQADFLIVYSTVKGSWFIQSLCQELKTKAFELDLLTILTFVSQRVALDFESNVPDNITMHRQKQIPCIMSMLTRLIQFKPI